MKIAVLGAAGQLGRDLFPRLTKLGEVVSLSRADIDLANPAAIPQVMASLQPNVFINCAAYNLVDQAEVEAKLPLQLAFQVNDLGLKALAHECAAIGSQLVHFSTDYVFGQDKTRTTPYTEEDEAEPLSVYGVTKQASEKSALEASKNNLVIRTCGLFGVWGSGGKGGNFVETMLRVAGQSKPLKVVNDQRCTPSYTTDVATATVALIERGATGLFHVVNRGDCTWYEFAAEIFRQSGLAPDLTPITSAEFGAPAKRPAYSVLSTAKLVSVLGAPLPAWQDALAAYLIERRKKPA